MKFEDIDNNEYFFVKNPKTKDKNLLCKIDENTIMNCENGLFVKVDTLTKPVVAESVATKVVNINVIDKEELIIYTINPLTGTVVSKQEIEGK